MAHITLSQLTTVLQRIVSWATGKFAAKNTYSGKIEYTDMPVVVLASMGSELDGTSAQRPMSAGSTYYLPAGQGAGARIMFVDSNGTAVKISNPESNVIYCNAYTGLLYRWDASESDMVPVGGDVDSLRKVYVDNSDFSSLDTLYSGVYQVIDQTTQRIIGVLVASSDGRIGVNPYFVTQWLFSNLLLSDEYSGSFNGYNTIARAHIIHRFYNASNTSYSDIPLNTWSEWKVYGLTLDEMSEIFNSKVSSISVNGGTAQQPTNGVVNLTVAIAADMVRVNNDNFDGETLDEVLDDVYTKTEVDDLVDGIEAGETVVINSDGANIVDEHDNNSVLLAPSARQMKLMYNNLMAIYNGLANIAFTNGKPTLDWVGSKTKYTLAYGTLNGCTADVAAGQVNEGALRIKLTPTQASYAFTSVTVNGESASTTATGDADGSVYLDIIVNGNITVAATAISGRAVNFNGTGCSIGAAGVATGHDLDTTITANEHFTLPASITVKIGNANVTHTYTRAQDNKTATLHIDAANITGDLTITCTAVEEAHAVLNLSNVGSGVTVNKANNAHLYVGDTITILPASGNKVTASATVGGNAVTLNGNTYDGYTYTIGSGDVSSSGTAIAITATASALQTCSIDLSGVTSDVGVTWNTPSAAVSTILEGSPFSITLAKVSGTGVLQISTSTMGSETIQHNNGTIATNHVTGNITIAASVAATPTKVHSYDVSDVTTIHDDTLDTDVHYIPDTVGNFNLYSTDDTGMTTQASYGGGKYPSGYYANGIFDDSKNNGKSYRYGYGERVLEVEQGSSFTLVWKGAKQYGTTINNYDTKQIKMLFYDRITTVTYASGYNRESIGQFQLQLSCSNNADSNTSGKMKPHITYSRGGEQKSLFSGGDSDVGVPKTFPTGVTSYDVVVAFDSSAGKTKAWVITHDTNNGDSVAYSGEVETNTIFMPCVAIKSTAVDGLDIYNYAMTQDDVEGLISNNE